ncbi:Uncharacterised protein [Mycobacteroides abscessus subsp. abscessus]|jgi:hypothetical protein|uniref:hypothetical protein n=1 Tax=Mycobacteroides abscessus TaxID=36809 RepID=UPI00092B5E8F|nr:hypothetical protein [Mycobacteroides abscessus]SIH22971.1 Uncharacterised protein [Mycobacteroides abscessus subsp. abscessus]
MSIHTNETPERICPCGCGKTRENAIAAMMRGPAMLNYDQAAALLDKQFESPA